MTKESTAQDQPAATSSSSASGSPAPVDRKKLTAKQQRIYDLKVDGKTRQEIAAEVGISVPVVSKTLVTCYRKLGIKPGESPMQNATEFRNPEVAAGALLAASDPWIDRKKEAIDAINKQLQAAGLPGKVSEALVRRLASKYAGAVYAAKELRTAEILEMLGKKIDLCAFYLDDKVMGEASARDIMLGMSALIEKRNLLRGEPTQIISDRDRMKLNELMPALLAEAKRREAVTVDGNTGEVVESR